MGRASSCRCRPFEIASFEPEELFGTKLRALLQRRKNRDLFDLHHGLEQLALVPDKLIGDDPEAVKEGLRESFRRLLAHDFAALLMAHGDPMATGGKAALIQFTAAG
jgi:hypothetical protein